MKSILITGGAGFIGANFVKYMLKQYPNSKLIILDALTYAGNMKTLEEELSQITFIKGSINNATLVSEILIDHDINIIINFAAEFFVEENCNNHCTNNSNDSWDNISSH